MDILAIVSFFYIIFDVFLISIYFHVFLSKKNLSKFVLSGIYLLAVVSYFCSSIYLSEAYQRTIVYLAVCFLLTSCYSGAVTYKLILVAVYASIGIIIENIVSLFLQPLECILNIQFTIISGSVIGTILSSLLFVIVIICMWCVQKNYFEDRIEKHLKSSYSDLLFSVTVFITILLSYAIYYLTLQQSLSHGLTLFFFLEGLLLVFNIMVFFIVREMELLHQKKTKTVLLEQMNLAQEEFYKEAIEKNQQLKKIVHDEKNFLIGIAGLLKNNKNETAIHEIEEKIEQLIYYKTEYTGIIALDTVLNAKIQYAIQNDIRLLPAVALYGELYINELDLVLILGNAFDNAIEAVEKIENMTNKIIHMNMKMQDGYVLIEIRNPVCSKVAIHNQTIQTTKQNIGLHGYGLERIRTLVEKYNGTMLLECDESQFSLKLILENIRV